MNIRKNITISKGDFETISEYAKKSGYTFSEILRKFTIETIQKKEEQSLVEYLNSKVDFVSKEEQKEIEKMNLDFSDTKGKELNLKNVL